jgi:hypothetical protein
MILPATVKPPIMMTGRYCAIACFQPLCVLTLDNQSSPPTPTVDSGFLDSFKYPFYQPVFTITKTHHTKR